MAGSYRHIADRTTGAFLGVELLDNLRDAYEALEECYDMIQYLTGGDRDRIAEAWLEGHLRKARAKYGHEIGPEMATKLLADYWRPL